MKTAAEKWLLGLALIGIILSAYATTLHFNNDGSKLCDINENFSCDKVNKSTWSTFLGVPVAILGLLSYLLIFLVVLKRNAVQSMLSFTDKDFTTYLSWLLVVMFLFQAYLTAMEVFFIHAYCIVCLGSQATILAMAIISWKLR